LKLVHIPSCSVVANWPTHATPLNHVECIDFSYDGRYIAIGNKSGKVLLYQFPQYEGSM
jgi:U3 small nucleolar RNA-associated protein 18